MTPKLRRTCAITPLATTSWLTTMAAELLAVAAQRDLAKLDEKIYARAPPGRRSGTQRAARSRAASR